MAGRLDVRKTYKLYLGGAFPRSESGRTYEVVDGRGRFLANAALRVAQGRARRRRRRPQGLRRLVGGDGLQPRPGAVPGGRADGGPAGPVRRGGARGRGWRPGAAGTAVDAAIDRWVWYAGWTDKIGQVAGSSNPVAGPYFNFSTPEPTGVVARWPRRRRACSASCR